MARQLYEASSPGVPWEELPPRSHRRLRERTKHWLNTDAVDRMTPVRLADVPSDRTREHSIGVSVSATNAETQIATATEMPNS